MTVMFVVTMTTLVQALLKIATAWKRRHFRLHDDARSAGHHCHRAHRARAFVVYHCVGRLFKGGKQDAPGATNAA